VECGVARVCVWTSRLGGGGGGGGGGGLGVISLPPQNSALLIKFLTKLHSDDLGDRHHLDTPIKKDIVAWLASFRSISKISLGNASSCSHALQ
jgi:hypothetical protein